MGLYRVYKCFWQTKWCRPGGGEGKERERPVVPTSATIDMTGFHGQAALKQLEVYKGGDAKNAFSQLREDLCSDCMESSLQEEAWRRDEHRRPRERVSQAAQEEGHLRRGERAWRRGRLPPSVTRSRSVESF